MAGSARKAHRMFCGPTHNDMWEKCAICSCRLQRGRDYAKPTINGRSHASRHHYVAERFFGRSGNRRGTTRKPIFPKCPWEAEGQTAVFCYECHEELLHNPVFLPSDIARLAKLVRLQGLSETQKTNSRRRIAGRIQLLHKIIDAGLSQLVVAQRSPR